MATAAEPFVELLRAASLAFADAREALEEGSVPKLSSDTAAYACNSLIVGLERLGVLTRRYGAAREYRDAVAGLSTNWPIISDPAFRAAADALAAVLEVNKPQLGIAATRLSRTIKKWLETCAPQLSQQLGVQVEAAVRGVKRKLSRCL